MERHCTSSFDHSKGYTSWFLTLNNFEKSDVEKLVELRNDSTFKFLCLCKDVAPTTSTEHLHAVFVLSRTQKLNWLKTHVSKRANFERVISSVDFCCKYIRSGGSKVVIYDDGDYLQRKGSKESLYSQYCSQSLSAIRSLYLYNLLIPEPPLLLLILIHVLFQTLISNLRYYRPTLKFLLYYLKLLLQRSSPIN
jgi:hypothetical protein